MSQQPQPKESPETANSDRHRFAKTLAEKQIYEKFTKAFEGDVEKWFGGSGRKDGQSLPDFASPYFKHSEPLVTSAALSALFSEIASRGENVCEGLTRLVNALYPRAQIAPIVEVKAVRMEVQQARIESFDAWVRGAFESKGAAIRHPYYDRNDVIAERVDTASAHKLEGSTHHDAVIHCKLKNETELLIVIEAKYFSDAAYQVTFGPVRNQVARILDCVIDLHVRANESDSGVDVRFLALTPGMFRPADLPALAQPSWSWPGADRSRLLCYKMREYLDSTTNLVADIPHRAAEVSRLNGRIGWASFEDLIQLALDAGTLSGNLRDDFKLFMRARALWPA